MTRLFAFLLFAGALLVSPSLAFGQAAGSTDVEQLRKEIDLLKREIDLLKRENELLKRENALLKKSGTAKAPAQEGNAVTRVTVDNVEYVYGGTVRNGAVVIVTVLATSKDGIRQGPNGPMILIDENGEKYTGMPVRGFGTLPSLREGIPVKLMWQFGATNPFGGTRPAAPSPKITRYAGVIIQRAIAGDDSIDFRNVPAVIAKKP
jgi:hypothetical protein